MPRVAPLYRFIKMFYLESRKMRFGSSFDATKQEALRIWEIMTHTDRQRFRERLSLYELEDLPAAALVFYREIEQSSDALLNAIAEDAIVSDAELILGQPNTPIFFLQVQESQTYLGYPEELSIVKFSLAGGIENYYHALFSIQGLDEEQLSTTITTMKSELHVVPIRDHEKEKRNMRDLCTGIRCFTMCQKLYTQHTQTRSAHAIMQLLNRVDVRFEFAMHEIFEAEALLRVLGNEEMPERDITQVFWRTDKSKRGHLACDFHQACQRSDKCTLLNALVLAETFGELFARLRKVDGSTYFMGYRPPGNIFAGSGAQVDPFTLCDGGFDGLFRMPQRK